MDNLTIMHTRDMSMDDINNELITCSFISSIMNLGIASQEKWKRDKTKKVIKVLEL